MEAKRIADILVTAISEAVHHHNSSINDLDLVSASDLGIIYSWNSKELNSTDACVHDIVEQRTSERANAPAVCAWDGDLTYAELEEQASRLASHLRHLEIKPGVIVPFAFRKSVWAVVSMLAILKAGGAPVALSPEYPLARSKAIIQSTGAKLLLADHDLASMAENLELSSLVVDKSLFSSLASHDFGPKVLVSSHDVAFIQFTSGSTGEPKGIILEHGAFCSSAMGQQSCQHITGDSRVLQFAAYTFDAALQEIFTTLMAGGVVCVPSEERRMDHLGAFIRETNVNWAFFTPTLCQSLKPKDVPTIKTLVLGGETASQDLLKLWAPEVTLFNGYGPSECCICCAVRHLSGPSESAKNIGRALPAVNLWITRPSNHNLLAPIGAIGELVVQGPNLSRGYLNANDKTSAAFVENVPWLAGQQFSRSYKTGDLVCYNADGTIEFIGRKDNQFKLRGHRIEAGEIEHQIRAQHGHQHLQVAVEATPISHHGLPGQETLVAYLELPLPLGALNTNVPSTHKDHAHLVREDREATYINHPSTTARSQNPGSVETLGLSPNQRTELEDLKTKLGQVLPAYMIPKLFVPLEHLPVNMSGKIDRKVLRSIGANLKDNQILEFSLGSRSDRKEPRNQREAALLTLWARALKMSPEDISISDEFFSFGDSIAAITLVAMARDDGFILKVVDVFENPTLDAQAVVMREQLREECQALPPFSLVDDKETLIREAATQCSVTPDDVEDILPCTEMQSRMLFHMRDGESEVSYLTQPSRLVFEILPGVDLGQFKLSWLALMKQNTILRTSFIVDSHGNLLQTVIGRLQAWKTANDLDECLADRQWHTPPKLGEPLVQFALVETISGSNFFLLSIHPSVYDSTSLQLLFDQLQDVYASTAKGAIASYSRFIDNLRRTDDAAAAMYWMSELSSPAYLHFPDPKSARPTGDISRLTLTASVATNHTWDAYVTESIVRLAWAVVLSNQTLSEDVLFGTTHFGGNASFIGSESTTGPTEVIVPFRLRLSRSQSIGSAVRMIQEQMDAIGPHAYLGLKKIGSLGSDGESGTKFQNLLLVHQRLKSPTELTLLQGLSHNNGRLRQICPLTLESTISHSEGAGTGVELSLTFEDGVIAPTEANAVLRQTEAVLLELISKPVDASLAELDLLSSEDYIQITSWNAVSPLPVRDTAHSLFEKRSRQQPQATAVESWEGQLTYQELDKISSILASHLLYVGMKTSGDVIPLCFEKSMWTIVSILGVMKAGAAFLLLDPSHPSERLRKIVEEVNSDIILCSSRHATKATPLAAKTIMVDCAFFMQIRQQSTKELTNTLPEVTPDAIMYVFYTSGSTGTPKGHRTPHQAFCSAATAQAATLGFDNSIRNFQFASYAFDVCISDMLTGLCAGTCVCIPSEDERLNDVAGAMARLRVNFANLTPTVARLLDPELLPDLRTLLLGGEALQDIDVAMWASRVKLKVGYGPSECSPRSTINPRVTLTSNPRNIGFPSLCNCRGWIVDPIDHNRLLSIGLVGELVIEGPTVCAGYIQSEKKESVFIEPPSWFSSFEPAIQPCGRLYKTGDLVRYDEDGSLIFVGRKDTQVKLHGQRIELQEIESYVRVALADTSFIHIVAELISPGGLIKGPSLVVFVQFRRGRLESQTLIDGASDEDAGGLHEDWRARVQEHLSKCLSGALVPEYYVSVDSIPLLPSGKIDHKRLCSMPATLTAEQLGLSIEDGVEKIQPKSREEYRLRQIWATVFKVDEREIGTSDNFFNIGGDSVAAIKLVGEARKIGFDLTVMDIFNSPLLVEMAQAMTADTNGVIPQETRRSIDLMERISREWDLDFDVIEDVYATTPLQKGLIALTTRKHRTNTLQQVYHLAANIDINRFRDAWELVVSQNAILRTRVVFTKDLILQVLLREDIVWQTGTSLQDYLDLDNEDPFDYGTRLARFALISDQNGAHYFVWTAHHVVYDGWSHFQTLKLVKEAYNGSIILPSAPFKNFVAYLESNKNATSEAFWRAELDGFSGSPFPALPRPEYWPLTDRAVEHTILLPQRSKTAMTVTLSTVIRCAWALTVGLYNGARDIMFGAVQTGRSAPLPGITTMMGPTITVVPVRVQWSDSIPVIQLLHHIQSQSTRTIPFEHLGIKTIQGLGADCLAACAFQNLLIVQPEKDVGPPLVPGMRPIQVTDTEYPSYVLSVQCSIRRSEIAVHASYDSSVLSADTVGDIVHQFGHLIQQINSTSETQTLDQLRLVNEKDLKRIINWNSADLIPVGHTVTGAIEQQMRLYPDALAICQSGYQELSYGELDKLSTCLALYLRELGIGPEKIVPVCFDKSIWAVVGILAVLRAGGICTTLDPSHPPIRHQRILEEVNASLILASPEHSKRFLGRGLQIILVNRSLIVKLKLDTLKTISSDCVRPENGAFVVFTSGSTGKPKGIMLEHGSICATSRGNAGALEMAANSRVLQFASFAFDVAIEDICITLMHGACICIASEHDRSNDLSGAMARMQVTWADLTPSVARTLDPEAIPSLQTLVMGGEMLGEDIIEQWSNKVQLFNTYGPAECTIYSTTTSALKSKARGSNIGRAIGCACWVVDPRNHNQLVPVGCLGELLIEGPNLARGYLRDEAKTRKAFVYPSWLKAIRGMQSRCYATGDLVQQMRDGSFNFVGRKDSQIKLRGQRIELGEIEHQISKKLPSEWAAAVEVIRTADQSAQQTLAVFFWPTQGIIHKQEMESHINAITAEAQIELVRLRKELAQVLPTYMVPNVYIPLSHPPSTTTGKLDRKILRKLGAVISISDMNTYALGPHNVEKREPRTKRERELQDLWATVLGKSSDSISAGDSFFQIGGESIAAIRLAAAARRLGLQITVAQIFENPLLSEMATHIKTIQQDVKYHTDGELGSELTIRVSRQWGINYESIQDVYPCTWLQDDMIKVTRRAPEANTLRYIAHIDACVDLERYKAAWEQVVSDNPILRTRIVRLDEGRMLQVVVDEKIEWKTATTLDGYVKDDQSTPFDYGTPLNRFALVKDPSSGSQSLVFTSHHASYDGWSMRQLHNSVARRYIRPNSQSFGPPFKDLVRYVKGIERSSDYADFWRSQLENFRGRDFPSLPSPSYKPLTNSVVEMSISLPELSSTSVTISTLLHAAYAIVIGVRTGVADVCFGAIRTGRSIPLAGVADILGPAITLVPIRVRWDATTTVNQLVRALREQSISMIAHEHVSKAKVVALNTDCAAACAYNSLLIVQPVVEEISGIDGIRAIPTKYPEFLEYGLSLECKLRRADMVVQINFDDCVIDTQAATRVISQLELVLGWLACANEDERGERVENLVSRLSKSTEAL